MRLRFEEDFLMDNYMYVAPYLEDPITFSFMLFLEYSEVL